MTSTTPFGSTKFNWEWKTKYVVSEGCNYLTTVTYTNQDEKNVMFKPALVSFKNLDVYPKVGFVEPGQLFEVHFHRRAHAVPDEFQIELQYFKCNNDTTDSENLEKRWTARRKKEIPEKLIIKLQKLKLEVHLIKQQKVDVDKLLESFGLDTKEVAKMPEMIEFSKTQGVMNEQLVKCPTSKLTMDSVKAIINIFHADNLMNKRLFDKAMIKNGKIADNTWDDMSVVVKKKMSSRILMGCPFIECDPGWFAEEVEVTQPVQAIPEFKDLNDQVFVGISELNSLRKDDRIVSIDGHTVTDAKTVTSIIGEKCSEERKLRVIISRRACARKSDAAENKPLGLARKSRGKGTNSTVAR